MVEDGTLSHKIDYITIFKEIWNLKGHQNCITGLKVTTFFDEWVDFAYWWHFSGEGSAPAASAAGLFLQQNIHGLEQQTHVNQENFHNLC